MATSPSSTPTPPPVAGLVGRWQRITNCPELVSDLEESGLAPLAPYAWLSQTSSDGIDSFAEGSPAPTKTHPCAGALARRHSHFFDPSGNFGSLDWLGGQVDDGTYRLLDDDTVRISGVDFHFRITNGDTLSLSPMLSRVMVRQALAQPDDYSDADWAVSVAYPGQTLEACSVQQLVLKPALRRSAWNMCASLIGGP